MEDLINEDFTEEFSILAEEEIRDGKKQICFKGIFSEADKMNRNHRIYPRKILKEAYEQAWDMAQKSGSPIIGECEHAQDSKIHLERIAVTFPELVWNEEKGTIEGKAVPTDTEMGHLIEGLAKSGIKICFSTRCSGKVKPYRGPLAEGVMNAVEVQPGLKIISIDVVGQPSCQAAVTDTVYESEALNESVNNIITAKQIFDEEF
jgi:hypothetical protein